MVGTEMVVEVRVVVARVVATAAMVMATRAVEPWAEVEQVKAAAAMVVAQTVMVVEEIATVARVAEAVTMVVAARAVAATAMVMRVAARLVGVTDWV